MPCSWKAVFAAGALDMSIANLTVSSIRLPLAVSHLSVRPFQQTSADAKPEEDSEKDTKL